MPNERRCLVVEGPESGDGAGAARSQSTTSIADLQAASGSDREPQWLGVSVACKANHSDELAAHMADRFAVGGEITPDGIRFYLPIETIRQRDWEDKLGEALGEFRDLYGVDSPLPHVTNLVADEGWADRWKEHFKPLRVGRRFIVCPTWEEPLAAEIDRVIRMDPGQAFGTGHHETTRLCLEWLENYDDTLVRHDVAGPKPSLLDVGTGTGILAIGAALLGWQEIVAIDSDPVAVVVAADNLILNGMQGRIRLATGEIQTVQECFDVVVANIQALPLMGMADMLKEKLHSTGHLVLSGILLEQRDTVIAAFGNRGLGLHMERRAGEWCLLEFVPTESGT
jgi:ribosomal protein L11 methyltransferase